MCVCVCIEPLVCVCEPLSWVGAFRSSSRRAHFTDSIRSSCRCCLPAKNVRFGMIRFISFMLKKNIVFLSEDNKKIKRPYFGQTKRGIKREERKKKWWSIDPFICIGKCSHVCKIRKWEWDRRATIYLYIHIQVRQVETASQPDRPLRPGPKMKAFRPCLLFEPAAGNVKCYHRRWWKAGEWENQRENKKKKNKNKEQSKN